MDAGGRRDSKSSDAAVSDPFSNPLIRAVFVLIIFLVVVCIIGLIIWLRVQFFRRNNQKSPVVVDPTTISLLPPTLPSSTTSTSPSSSSSTPLSTVELMNSDRPLNFPMATRPPPQDRILLTSQKPPETDVVNYYEYIYNLVPSPGSANASASNALKQVFARASAERHSAVGSRSLLIGGRSERQAQHENVDMAAHTVSYVLAQKDHPQRFQKPLLSTTTSSSDAYNRLVRREQSPANTQAACALDAGVVVGVGCRAADPAAADEHDTNGLCIDVLPGGNQTGSSSHTASFSIPFRAVLSLIFHVHVHVHSCAEAVSRIQYLILVRIAHSVPSARRWSCFSTD